MTNKDIFLKTLLFILFASASIWFGSSIVRNSIALSLYEPGSEMLLKDYLSESTINNTIQVYGSSAYITATCYIVSFLITSIFLFLEFNGLKKKAWLFMIFILFYLSAIAEIQFLISDIEIALAIQDGLDKNYINELFFLKYNNKFLNAASGILFFAYSSIIALLIFKPLDNTKIPNL